MERIRHILEPLLLPERVVGLPAGLSKQAIVALLGDLACKAAGVPPLQREAVLQALWDRELILSTGIGLGIGVPHVRHAGVSVETMVVGRSKEGVSFDSIDGNPVYAIFTILMPAGQHRRHVEVLGGIAASLKDEARRASVFAAPDAASFVQRLLSPR